MGGPCFDDIPFSVFSTQGSSLSKPFSLDEVDIVVVDCDGNMSLRPDGFNFAIIKAFWNMMRPNFATFR